MENIIIYLFLTLLTLSIVQASSILDTMNLGETKEYSDPNGKNYEIYF